MTAAHGSPNERRAVLLVLAVLGVLAISRGFIHSDHVWYFAAIIPSIILHEVSHGAVAFLFGDATAKRAGRLTLNPIAHIDLFGTLLMPAMLVLAGAAPFGYAKPVPVNLGQLRSPRNQGFLVSLAGPATNVALAALAVVAYRVMRPVPGTNTWEFVVAFGFVNVLLATFNMLPIPPLDGSALIERALPRSMWPGYLKVRRYSMPLLIVIVFAFPSAFAHVYEPMLRFWERLAAG